MKGKKLSTIQKREKLNDVIRMGNPGPGGAYHDYEIWDKDYMTVGGPNMACIIEFQKGPRNVEDSRHGVCDQDLLEIVRDRLACFQAGDMPTRETGMALQHVEEALLWLNKRTEDRIERGVLGTYNK